jgi:type I restriction enzyme S subunit
MAARGFALKPLGKVVSFANGKSIKPGGEGAFPVYGSNGIIGYNDATRFQNAIIIGRVGAYCGSIAYCQGKFWASDNTIVAQLKDQQHDIQFLNYLLLHMNLNRWAGGAAQPLLTQTVLKGVEAPIPLPEIQHKIATILSAYDNLIDNNLRRINILEEMAQNLYREWFVKFRFPGHEKARMVDSPVGKIPDGWEVVTVEEIVKRIPSGKKYDQRTAAPSGTVPILDQGRSGIIGYHDDEPGIMASEDEPIIVFANHTCYQRIIQYPFSTIQNVLPFLPNPERISDIYWLHWATKDLVEFNDYKGHWPEFMSKDLPFPKTEVCSIFGNFAKPIVQNCHRLEEKNTNLRQTRDLLLPKLISGELNVSDLDIKTGGRMHNEPGI